jgi:hypothetical protein
MKFNLKIKDLLPTAKETKTFEWKELSDKEISNINGGGVWVPSTSKPVFSLQEYYKLSGFWGG